VNPPFRARPRRTRGIVVLGMHRSGTSALAGALRLVGADLGRNLMPATAFNPEGHFEHAEVVAHDERLLEALGSRWDDLRPLPGRWWERRALAGLDAERRELLRREFGASGLWAIKDPRMCRLLPGWTGAFQALDGDWRCVLIARDPREVARSLASRDGFTAWKSHVLYLDHMLAAERSTRDRPRAFITYEELLEDGPAALRRIGQELDLGWSARVTAESARLQAFLRPRLRHHTALGSAGRSRLERMTGACYAAFAAAAAGDEAALATVLGPIADLLDEVVVPWTRGMTADAVRRVAQTERQLLAARRSIEALAGQVDEARQGHEARDAGEAALRDVLKERDAEIGRARHSIQVLAREIEASRQAHQARDRTDAELREVVQAREAEVGQARAHIERLSAEIAQARATHEARDATEAALRDALRARAAEVDEARRHIEGLAAQIDKARGAHEQRDVTEDVLRQELAARDREIEAAREHIRALGREIDGARRAFEARDRTEADLLRAAAAREEEARAARQSLETLADELDSARRAMAEHTRRETELRQALAAAEAALTERAEAMSRLVADLEEHVSLERELEVSLIESVHELGDLKQTLLDRRRWWRRSQRTLEDARLTGLTARTPPGGRFALDQVPEQTDRAEITVTGWHVPPAGRTLRRLVVRAGRHRFKAEPGGPRPDVERVYPGLAGAGASGFTAHLRLPPGDHRLLFEAQYDDGNWHPVETRSLRVTRPALAAALDAPRGAVASGSVRFAGWCFHPHESIKRLTLTIGGRTVDCTHGLPRPDVQAEYPDHPGAGTSGFEAVCRVRPGRGRVTLHAELESGAVLVHVASDSVLALPSVVLSPARHLRGASRSARVAGGVAAHIWRRLRRGGDLPPLQTIPRRLAHLVRLQRLVAGQDAPSILDLAPTAPADEYACWLKVNAWHERARGHLARRLAAAQPRLPRISLVTAGGPGPAVAAMRTALRRQEYPGWELCLAVAEGDGASTHADVAETSQVFSCPVPGGATHVAALNAAAERATGEFLLVCARPVALTPDALGELALFAAEHPESDVVYSDHDRLDENGQRLSPWFKPDWSPELLLSCMYLGPAWMVRRTLFERLGGLREALAGAAEHDLALRAAEQARAVGHVPFVLFQALDGADAAPDAGAAARAVREAFERRGVPASVDPVPWTEGNPALRPTFGDEGPEVTVIVLPGRDAKEATASLDAWRASGYRPLDVRLAGADGATTNGAARAALANAAAGGASADYLLFVEAGATPRDTDVLSRLMGYARLPGVGAVGARIVRSDGSVQHEGFVRSLHDGRGGARMLHGQRDGALFDGTLAANRSAVSGACLLTPRRLFAELGGFDTGAFAEAFHDLDYGYRLAQRGHRCVYVPAAEVVLDRDLAGAQDAHPQAEACFRRRHQGRADEFLSPHLAVGRHRIELTPRRLARGVEGPLRALMCSFNLNREGAPHVQLEMAVRLKKAGVLDPVVFCHQDGPLRQAYEAEGIEVSVGPHPLFGVFDGAGYDRAIAAFAEFARGRGAEVVYGNTVHAFYAVAAARAAGLPSLWNLHESEPVESHFAHLAPAVAARALECFHHPYRVVFVAEATRDVYRRLAGQHNFTVVHGALDMARLRAEAERWPREVARRSLGLANGEVALLLLGTVCERKGQHDLPEALRGLPPALWPRVRCFIVGDRGLGYGRRVARAREALPAALRERVAILPETAEPARFYQAADVFVCTSRVESFPRVTLEAMAHGLPLVTTPVFGIREQVRPGVNALLYEPGDTGALLAALVRLVADDAARSALASRARAVLDCLDDFDTMVAAYGEIFREAWLSQAPPHLADAVGPTPAFSEARDGTADRG
jgi:O-antigen biosynthesis protein